MKKEKKAPTKLEFEVNGNHNFTQTGKLTADEILAIMDFSDLIYEVSYSPRDVKIIAKYRKLILPLLKQFSEELS